ncbi:Alcohol dehydrogenase [acceptor] [compost metagenome]
MAESAGKYDYIIVGAGTAGCVLANRLSQDKGTSVLLIEAGAKDDYIWVHIPLGFRHMIDNPRTDWRYRTQAEAGLNGRSLLYPSGKILGGSSSINSMIYQRGQSQDYDNWADLTGDMSWRWEQVLPLFNKTEDHADGADSKHGVGGDWRIEKQKSTWTILDAFRDAAEQTGIPKINGFDHGEGSAYYYVNQKNGLRWNTAQAFLRTITRRGNLEIMTGSQVQRLIIEETEHGKVCTGVEFIGGGKEWVADVSRETILAAGTFGSPQILQRSGIGPASLLQEHGIRLLQDLPGVGENVQDHMPLRMRYKISGTKSLNTSGKGYLGIAAMGLEYLVKKHGLVSTVPSPVGAMVRSDASQARPNLSYQIQPWSQQEHGSSLDNFPALTASVSNLRPTSRGQVRVKSADVTIAPSIRMNYLDTLEDQNIASAAIQLTRKIMAAPALQQYAPQEINRGTDLSRLATELAVAGSNPVGSCKMGADTDAMAVVDSQLKVRGIAGLRIADASIMPVITAGDTGASTIMIAEKAAQLIRATTV